VSRIAGTEIRVGVGFDVHRLVPGRRLILGGVQVPFDQGLDGDSDADVLTHAILDALLGAGGLGDIGARFGVGRPEMRGISSLVLLDQVVALLAKQGYRPGNVDATVVAEAPRLAPHIPGMRKALAEVLRIAEDRVSVKSTTAKGLGPLGAAEGIATIAIASLIPAAGGRQGIPSHRAGRGRHGR
jgi:2-C-methyl-D-erythritol 2,4-cyclodiphosphate synthase